jgi:hypothetical protein
MRTVYNKYILAVGQIIELQVELCKKILKHFLITRLLEELFDLFDTKSDHYHS